MNHSIQPSSGASVDEYECVQNMISHETTYYIVFLQLSNLPAFKIHGRSECGPYSTGSSRQGHRYDLSSS